MKKVNHAVNEQNELKEKAIEYRLNNLLDKHNISLQEGESVFDTAKQKNYKMPTKRRKKKMIIQIYYY